MNKITKLYILLLAFHIAHVYEELVTNFIMIQKIGALGFLVLNLILFLIPLFFLFPLFKGYKSGIISAFVYPSIMVLNGLVHNIMVFVTGKYQDGYGGAITGIFLILTGVTMLYYVLKNKDELKQKFSPSD